MATISVTINKLRSHAVSTLDDAISEAQDTDTIKIYKNTVTMASTDQNPSQIWPVDKTLYVEGQGVDKTKIKLEPHQNGFMLANGNLTLKDLTIEVAAQSQAIVPVQDLQQGNVTLDNVKIVHADKIEPREYKPAIFLSNNGQPLAGSLTLINSYVDGLVSAIAKVDLNQSTIGRLDIAQSQLWTSQLTLSSDVELTNVDLENLDTSNPLMLTRLKTKGLLTIFGDAVIKHLTLLPVSDNLGFMQQKTVNTQLANYQRNQGFYLNLGSMNTNDDSQFNVYELSDVTFPTSYNPDNLNCNYGWFNFDHVSVSLKDTNLVHSSFKNQVIGGTLRLESVNDEADWNVIDNPTLSNRNSTSNLFNTLNPDALDASGSNSASNLGQQDALHDLNELIGLDEVKQNLTQLINNVATNEFRKKQHMKVTEISKHMVFTGNPGTGKTTVARLVAKALYEKGVLPENKLVEVSASDLISQNIGGTRPQTKKVVMSAIGGVLFVDEAYSLTPSGGNGPDYGSEAVDELIKLMEDHRDNLVVIMAGYTNEMKLFFQKGNPGLKSRFRTFINFADYTPRQMVQILQLDLQHDELHLGSPEVGQHLVQKFGTVLHGSTSANGNGRLVRNFVDELTTAMSTRIQPELQQYMETNQEPPKSLLSTLNNADIDMAVEAMQRNASNMSF